MSLEEAKDPTTPPTRLRELSQSQDDAVVSLIAQHPKTPHDILFDLAQRYPASFLQNPALPQLFSERPAFLRDLSRTAAQRLAEVKEAPQAVSELLVGHLSAALRQEIAGAESTAPALLCLLAKDEDRVVRVCVAQNPKTPASLLEALSTDPSASVRLSVATNSNAAPALLARLAKSWEKEILAEVVQNPSTPVETLLSLAKNYTTELLQNPVIPLLLLEDPNFLHRVDSDTAYRLVFLPGLPSWALESLACHPDGEVRSDVAANEVDTPPALLMRLADDIDPQVRRWVAKNPNTPIECLWRLANDPEPTVRYYLAQNQYAPISLMEKLVNDKEDDVRYEALAELSKRRRL